MKRLFDLVVSASALIVLAPLLAVLAVLVKVTSTGPVVFRQVRVGRNFQPFEILKFRSMVVDAPLQGPQITAATDRRITAIGKLLRKTKLDELPQLLNVLKGDMSFVGPRPEVPRYVAMFRDQYAEILQVRPGITDLATLTFRHESELLAAAVDPEQAYCESILPAKIKLSQEYIRQQSFLLDLSILFRTLRSLFSSAAPLDQSPAS